MQVDIYEVVVMCHLSIHPPYSLRWQSVCLSVCLSVLLFVCLSVPCICVSLCVRVCGCLRRCLFRIHLLTFRRVALSYVLNWFLHSLFLSLPHADMLWLIIRPLSLPLRRQWLWIWQLRTSLYVLWWRWVSYPMAFKWSPFGRAIKWYNSKMLKARMLYQIATVGQCVVGCDAMQWQWFMICDNIVQWSSIVLNTKYWSLSPYQSPQDVLTSFSYDKW